MKSIPLFFLTVFAITMTANAQITEGNWLVGGDAYFNATTYKYKSNETTDSYDDTFNEYRINPNIGYFFVDKLVGGLQINLAFTNTTPGGIANNRGRSYGLGPFMRYYFLDTDKQINVFAQANYALRFGEKNQTENAIDWSGYGLTAGTVVFLNQSVGIELSLDYSTLKRTTDDFKVNNLSVGLGLQIHLKKK